MPENNQIIEYKERERGILPMLEGGYQDMEFERTIHERIVIKK